MFNGSRLAIARKRAGLTMKDLAASVGVAPRAITGFEAGEYPPNDETAAKIAGILGYPLAFLLSDDADIPQPQGVSFRSMSKMTAKQRDAAVAAGALAFLLSDWLDQEFDLPAADVPDLRDALPDQAATELREYWGVGSKPIKNVVHLLESRGVRVFSLAENGEEVDAYSVWRGSRPYVFLNSQKSAERSRFDAAHELGHLVLHRHAAPVGLDAEKEANAFAAAFLMPEAPLRAVGRISTMRQVLELKRTWLVSVVAMIYRLFEAGIISKWTYQQLFQQASAKGWRKAEPYPMRSEQSQIWQKAFTALRTEGVGFESIADRLAIPSRELAKLVFGLATIPVSSATSGSKFPSPPRGMLRVVK